MTDQAEERERRNGAEKKRLQERRVETQHTVEVAGAALTYTACAGTLLLHDHEADEERASIFYVSYTKESDEAERATRPLLISFNGGPGSSSVWMHLGLLGPRRVASGDVGQLHGPPYELVDNAHSVLDVADLLFIDPVGTGYSRAASEQEAEQFYSIDGDKESVGDFIHLFVSREKRWASPKFLIGESYGTTRAAALAGYLQDRHGMYFNGIILVSAILNFQTAVFTTGNDLPYLLYLPSYSATAWYHGALAPELQAVPVEELLREAERFALDDYATALLRGQRLPDDEAQRVAEQVARLTGLSADFVRRSHLRVRLSRFVKELLRDQHRTVGRLDSRFQGIDRDAAGEAFEYDPSYSAILGPYTAALNDYLGRELAYESDLIYEILTGLYEKWDYGENKNRFVDVAETLRAAMSRNPRLRVMVASGYYDLATPYFATDYTVDHLALDPSLRDNIETSYYPAGHMMYVHEPSLEQLGSALRRFIRRASGQGD